MKLGVKFFYIISRVSFVTLVTFVSLVIYNLVDFKTTFSVVPLHDQHYNQHQWLTVYENINDANIQSNANIFFLETKATKHRKLSSHQSCSIESAAKAYPDKNVFVLFASEESSIELRNTLMVKALGNYRNIHFKHLNVIDFARNTSLEAWLASDHIAKSKFKIANTANVLRLLTLWKYGGFYLDLDVIVTKELNETNFVCFENKITVNNAILNLVDETGREFATKFMNNFMQKYNGSKWGNNGPSLVTRVIESICPKKDKKFVTECAGFSILPQKNCYEIGFKEWKKLFTEENAAEVYRRTNESYFIHLWNKMHNNFKVSLESQSAIIGIAKQFCPRVLESRYDDF